MDDSLQLLKLQHTRTGETPRLTIELSIGNAPYAVWYQASVGPIAGGAHTALASTLIPMMKIGGALHIPGPISQRLSQATTIIQDILHAWNRQFRKIPVTSAGTTTDAGPPSRGVACFFSGGVDSFYTLLKHQAEITHLIFVRGADLNLTDHARYQRALSAVQAVAVEFGKTLIEVETNIREFSDRYADWADDYHGACLAGIAHLFSPILRKVYIGSTGGYQDLHPWGSHPLLDPLWSTEDMELVHDGAEATRFEKLARIVQQVPVRKLLRVCPQPQGVVYNCGRCEKCLRTMVALRILKVLEECPIFDRPLDLAMVARIDVSPHYAERYVRMHLEALGANGGDPPLAEALHDALNRLYQRGILGWPARGRKFIHRKLFKSAR